MGNDTDVTYFGSAKDCMRQKYLNKPGYLMVTARVMLVGFGPGSGTYVAVDFVPPPAGGPLGVSTIWDDRGVELAKFAMAHGKRLVIVYRQPGFTWSDVVDICVVDY